MKRRIREAIVGVAAIIVLALGIPLAIVVHRLSVDAEVVELQARAATALGEIDIPVQTSQIRAVAHERDVPARFAVYDTSGNRIYGRGPRRADALIGRALQGTTASSTDGQIAVATPIAEPGSEDVHGALLVTESLAGADARSRSAWLVMGVAAVAALGLAWAIGTRLARLLSDPLVDLAASATTIGEVGSIEPRPPTGIAEIDELAAVLARRAQRVHESLQRERQFSADVSHQLRTPITALRLKLEGIEGTADDEAGIAEVFAGVDRLEDTVEHLLALAREATPIATELDLVDAVTASVGRWIDPAEAAGRTVSAETATPRTVHAHLTSVEEILDILIDNAVRHGTGAITVTIRDVRGGVAVDVADEGTAIDLLDSERIFDRRHGTGDGEGIGLSVARSIAEAEGARLVLGRRDPTTFSLVFVLE